MKMSFDDNVLLTGGADGAVVLWKVVDRDSRGRKMSVSQVTFSEEILIPRVELAEKVD